MRGKAQRECAEVFGHGRVGEPVQVFDHQEDVVIELLERTEERLDDFGPEPCPTYWHELEHAGGRHRRVLLQLGDELTEEHDGVVVAYIELHPDDRGGGLV